jgi:hypothetical protein
MNNPVSIKPVIVQSAGQPETAQVRKADLPQFKVELDDRAILLPDGKVLHHVIMSVDEGGHIAFDGVFAFNRTGRHPRLLRLSLADTGALAAELLVRAVEEAELRELLEHLGEVWSGHLEVVRHITVEAKFRRGHRQMNQRLQCVFLCLAEAHGSVRAGGGERTQRHVRARQLAIHL